jgi:hypothetical protein
VWGRSFWAGTMKSFQADISYRLVLLPLQFTQCISASLTAVASLELLFHDAAQHCLWFSLNMCLETGRPYNLLTWSCMLLHTGSQFGLVIIQQPGSNTAAPSIIYTHPIYTHQHVLHDRPTMLLTSIIEQCLPSWATWCTYSTFLSVRFEGGWPEHSKSSTNVWPFFKCE